jgi:hypothetical protein
MLGNLLKPAPFLRQVSVRFNCPWHRSNWTEFYFPFQMKDRVGKRSIQELQKKLSGRQRIMQRILREKAFLGWNHDIRTPEKRLSNPL